MYRELSSRNNWSSKDANRTAPSTTCAYNSAFTFNNAVVTGIAAAVSVFLLFAIISIISYGIIIRGIMITSAIIMPIIMCSVIIIINLTKKTNINAKLCKASF